MGRTQVVSMMRCENLVFGFQMNGSWYSSRLSDFWIFLKIFEYVCKLVDSLASNRKIPGYLTNMLFFPPLPDESLSVPIR